MRPRTTWQRLLFLKINKTVFKVMVVLVETKDYLAEAAVLEERLNIF